MAELIRSYVQASTQLPRSRWRRRLSHAAMLVWDDLIHWPTYSGVFRYDIEEAAWYYRIDPSDVDNALEQFVADGKIQRENDYVFVIDFISFQNYAPPSVKSARNELEKLASSAGAGLAAKAMQSLSKAFPNVKLSLSKGVATPILDEIRLDKIRRDKKRNDDPHAGRLADLEANLNPQVQMEWDDWKQMAASKRKSGKVGTLKLCKHLERIIAVKSESGLSDDAICYGLQSAIMAEADNHTYVLKAATNYKPGSYNPRCRVPTKPVDDDSWLAMQQDGLRIDSNGKVRDGDKVIEHTPEEIAAIKRNLGLALKSPTTI